MSRPLISIVVPHYNGREILYGCLTALSKTDYTEIEIIVVDNASTDNSVDGLKRDFADIILVSSPVNLGYAGGCNLGFKASSGAYVLFLNNDTVFEPGWLEPLVSRIESDSGIAAVQPKLRALQYSDSFDYSGAAGGLLDVYGFPFALGRLFFDLERDEGQYDRSQEIFWASGTAMLVRRSALQVVGLFDESFFAHMEEIDLCWRLQLAGHRVVSEPRSIVLHNSGSTLRPDSFKKIYLNHRNSVLMLVKNYSLGRLVKILPIRLWLEVIALTYSLFKLDLVRMRAIMVALAVFFIRLPRVLRERRWVQSLRKVNDDDLCRRMYKRSIVVDYFFRGKSRARDLGCMEH